MTPILSPFLDFINQNHSLKKLSWIRGCPHFIRTWSKKNCPGFQDFKMGTIFLRSDSDIRKSNVTKEHEWPSCSWRKEAIFPKRVTFYIKSSETSTNLKNVVFSLLLIEIWSFQEAFLSLLETFEFWQWNLQIGYLLYHCYICNIMLQMIQIQWNLT